MAKQKQEEVQEEIPVSAEEENSALATLGDAFDFLYDEMAATEVQKDQHEKLPILRLYMPGKKYSDVGANRGFVIDWGDGRPPEVNIESLRLARVDAPVMQRLMWPFDPNTGKRLQENDAKPACASSDGVSARKADAFGFIGKEFTDWRDKELVTIYPDNCKECPLGQWKATYNPDGSPVMDINMKGVPYHKRSAPPCQELPAYVFYDFDRKTLLLYQAANFTSATFLMGSNGRPNKRFKGVLKGVEEYYFTAQGTKAPDVMPQRGVLHPLNFVSRLVDNAPYGMTPAPNFSLGEPVSEQEALEYATAVQLYRADNVRSIISGEMWGLAESVAAAADESAAAVADVPF